MRKFTKLMLTLTLCVFGLGVACAEDAEEDKVYATFESPSTTPNTTWDADTWTFGWSATSYNQLHNIGLPSGNLTGYSKLVIDCSEMTGKFRILIYKGESNFTLWVEDNGVTEFVLSEAVSDMSFLTNSTEICLSGPNNTGTAPGSVKINSMYLVKAQDPLAAEKGALSDMIARAGFCNSVGKTEASYATFTSALSAAEAALVAADATAESLTAATTALEDAINGLTLDEGWADLTKEMFKTWASHDATEGTVNNGCAYNLYVSSDLPYGLSTVDWLNYANLTAYDKLYVTVTAGTPRFCFNRLEDGGQDNDDESLSKMIDIPNNSRSTAAFQTKDGANTYIINLKAMTLKDGFAILHSIKGANWGKVTVTGMYLYTAPDPLASYKEALSAKIDEAKAINTFGKSAQTVNSLNTAISDGEAALVAADATEESLTAAVTNITTAIAGLKLADGYTNLTAAMYKTWDSATEPTTGTNPGEGCAYNLNQSTGQPYGDGSVKWYHYADISEFSALHLLTTEGTPRVMMNREYAETGDGGSYVEITDAPIDGKVTVDLTAYPYAHMNAIKGANWKNVTITEMLLYRTITVGSTGYATFGSLDKSVKLNGVTGYAAVYEGGVLKLTEVTGVPAGKGVIIEAAAGEYAPTFDVEAEDIQSDLLVSNGTVKGDGVTIFALANGTKGVGFYKVANGQAVPAGKAYLNIAAEAREFIGFGGEATGIKMVENAAANNGEVFNLAGQRVAQPTKGLYIMNGKKVVIK